jgi:hypothetical protein
MSLPAIASTDPQINAIESAFSRLSTSDAPSQKKLIKKPSPPNNTNNPSSKPEKDPFSYRHYVTFHPAQNKILEKRWDERTRELHLKRLKNAQPSIDNSPPKVYPHLELRLKRLKLEEGILKSLNS